MSQPKKPLVKQSTRHKAAAAGAAVNRTLLRAASYGSVGGALAERLVHPEQPAALAVALGVVAVGSAMGAMAEGFRGDYQSRMSAWAKGREAHQAKVSANLDRARQQIAEQRGQTTPEKTPGVVRRLARAAIKPFLADKTPNITPATPQTERFGRTVEQGAQRARALVNQWDTSAGVARDIRDLDQVPPTPEPVQPAEPEQSPVAPAPAGQDPFPLGAVFRK